MYTCELKHTCILNLRNLPACNYMHAVTYCKVKSKSYMQLVTAQQVQYIDQKAIILDRLTLWLDWCVDGWPNVNMSLLLTVGLHKPGQALTVV